MRLAHSLVMPPDRVAGGPTNVERSRERLEAQATRTLDIALANITKTNGPKAARHVALFTEYPSP